MFVPTLPPFLLIARIMDEEENIEVETCRRKRKWHIFEWYFPDWSTVVGRHDKDSDQGARRINRRAVERHTAYGDDSWNQACRAQDAALRCPL